MSLFCGFYQSRFRSLCISQRTRCVLLCQVNSWVVPEWRRQLTQCSDSGQCIFPFIGPVLRISQREPVLKIVREKLEQGPVDVSGFIPLAGSLTIASLHEESLRPRQAGGQVKGFLRFGPGIFVIAELRPRLSQCRMRERVIRFDRYGILQKIARPERIKGTQSDEPFRIELCRFALRRQRDRHFRGLFACLAGGDPDESGHPTSFPAWRTIPLLRNPFLGSCGCGPSFLFQGCPPRAKTTPSSSAQRFPPEWRAIVRLL